MLNFKHLQLCYKKWETMEKKNVDCLTNISMHPKEEGFPLKHSSQVWEHRTKTDVLCDFLLVKTEF